MAEELQREELCRTARDETRLSSGADRPRAGRRAGPGDARRAAASSVPTRRAPPGRQPGWRTIEDEDHPAPAAEPARPRSAKSHADVTPVVACRARAHRRVRRSCCSTGRPRGRLRVHRFGARRAGVSLSSASTSICWRRRRATSASCGKTTACDFADVTVGAVPPAARCMRDLSAGLPRRRPTRRRRAAARCWSRCPGEQHTFGLVDGRRLLPPRRLGRLERRSAARPATWSGSCVSEWFDVVGLSVGCETHLDGARLDDPRAAPRSAQPGRSG